MKSAKKRGGAPKRAFTSVCAALLSCLLAPAAARAEAPAPLEPASAPGTQFATVPLIDLGRAPSAQPQDEGAQPGTSATSSNTPNKLGLVADVGFPDGAMISAAYRPWSWLRVQAGGGTNAVSAGVRAGVVVIPFGVGPSLALDGGWYGEGDANGIASKIAGSGYEYNATAKRIGYQFANAHLGLDFGRNNFTFFVHGGMSYVRTELHDINDVLGKQITNSQGGGSTTLNVVSDPVVTAFVPSLKLGLLVYFL